MTTSPDASFVVAVLALRESHPGGKIVRIDRRGQQVVVQLPAHLPVSSGFFSTVKALLAGPSTWTFRLVDDRVWEARPDWTPEAPWVPVHQRPRPSRNVVTS
jgi:hypothetical protein